MIEFYAPDIVNEPVLPQDESVHCCRVLRNNTGDTISVVDGNGCRYSCLVTDANPKKTSLEILSKEEEPKHWKGEMVMAVAPTKNGDRMEWFVEKAVEIGVDRIVFLQCQRSERRRFNLERVHRIAVSAMKQSLKARLPEISGMVPFDEFVKSVGQPQKLMAYCGDECELIDISGACRAGVDTVLLVGPEGDFSPGEVRMALDAGFRGVTFGRCRLRTETAALYGLTALHVLENVTL